MVLGEARWLTSVLAHKWLFWSGQDLLKTWDRPNLNQVRTSIFKPSGAIKPPPVIMPFGVLRVLSVMITFICFGTYISKTFTNFLEESNTLCLDFEDDDDDL